MAFLSFSKRLCAFFTLSVFLIFSTRDKQRRDVLVRTKPASTTSTSSADVTALETFVSTHVDSILDSALDSLSRRPRIDGLQSLHSTQHGGNPDHTKPTAPLCDNLGGQVVYMVGPSSTTYALHSYIIDALKPAPAADTSCVGPSFCPFHILCAPPYIPPHLPSTLAHHANKSHTRRRFIPPDVANTSTALLRYMPSTTLYAGPSAEDARFGRPVVDAETGVRVEDSRWVRAVGRADVLVLGRSPVPAPAWSYDVGGGRGAAWWLDELRKRQKNRLDARSGALLDPLAGHADDWNTTSTRILGAALHTTLGTFLPSILDTLDDLVVHKGFAPILEKKVVIWHGSWYLQTKGCMMSWGDETTADQVVLARYLLHAEEVRDPWNAYYNAQVYMDDRLLKALLHKYGIIYLPLANIAVARGMTCQHNALLDEAARGRMLMNGLNRAAGRR